MTPPAAVSAKSSELRQQLHELAQPMAVLQCRLELSLMSGGEPNLRDAIQGWLTDLRRAIETLNRVRDIVHRSETESLA